MAAVPFVLVSGAPVAAADTGPAHGLVGSTCDAARASADRSATVAVVVFGARWDLMFPTRGTADVGYRTALGNALRTCAAAGLRVVVDAGVQYVPSWAWTLPGADLVDQYSDHPRVRQLDLVFNAGVRTAVAEYLRELVADIPPYTTEAIRVGTSTSGEIGLPGGADGTRGHTDSWWAFGTAAQTGQGLAGGQSSSPMPGWVPGQRTWNGQTVTAANALTWFRWYERAVAQAEAWLAWSVAGSGWAGAYHLPVPGRGVLPAELTAATNNLLAGAAHTDDAFARGQDYVDQIPLFAQALRGVVIDLTSVDDATAVTARSVSPPQDNCTAADASTSVNPATAVATWSNLRFARAQVARAGLSVVGENPGPPGMQTGGVPNSDPETAQLSHSPGYARSCALAALLFAFEDDLYTGRSGITAAAYASAW